MKPGLLLGYSGRDIHISFGLIKRAKATDFDPVWVAEAYGSDAVTSASYIPSRTETIKVGTAIMQAPARTPANCAMTAMSLSQLSGGRFIPGLGASGPQVIAADGCQPPSADAGTRLASHNNNVAKQGFMHRALVGNFHQALALLGRQITLQHQLPLQ